MAVNLTGNTLMITILKDGELNYDFNVSFLNLKVHIQRVLIKILSQLV